MCHPRDLSSDWLAETPGCKHLTVSWGMRTWWALPSSGFDRLLTNWFLLTTAIHETNSPMTPFSPFIQQYHKESDSHQANQNWRSPSEKRQNIFYFLSIVQLTPLDPVNHGFMIKAKWWEESTFSEGVPYSLAHWDPRDSCLPQVAKGIHPPTVLLATCPSKEDNKWKCSV